MAQSRRLSLCFGVREGVKVFFFLPNFLRTELLVICYTSLTPEAEKMFLLVVPGFVTFWRGSKFLSDIFRNLSLSLLAFLVFEFSKKHMMVFT